ncbi:MAG TPA: hypothetical protein VKP88_05530 [Candidatus Paceibacterota bacterium]|nr:hypothetical protein [Candidatus Paceibacterota bacterium]
MTGSDNQLRAATDYLRARYVNHRIHYGGSFAEALNNDAAVQLAEVFFGVDTVQKAKESLSTEREPHPAEP